MADVFISYKSEQIKEAKRIRHYLEKNGFSCWMAPDCMDTDYSVDVPNAISECRAFVLVLSNAAQESVWVPKELDQALTSKKKIIPFVIEDCRLKNGFQFYLANVQCYPAFRGFNSSARLMLADLNAALGKPNVKSYKKMIIAFSAAFAAILAAVLVVVFAFNKGNTVKDADIEGIWVNSDVQFIFRDDGTFKDTLNGETFMDGEYTVNGNMITVTFSDISRNYTFEIKKQTLSMNFNGTMMTFEKIDSGDKDPLKLLCGNTWTIDNSDFTFEDDLTFTQITVLGKTTCTYHGTYTVNGDKISATYKYSKDTERLWRNADFAVDEDSLYIDTFLFTKKADDE